MPDLRGRVALVTGHSLSIHGPRRFSAPSSPGATSPRGGDRGRIVGLASGPLGFPEEAAVIARLVSDEARLVTANVIRLR